MGLYLEEWDHDYSRISAKLLKRGCILAVKEPRDSSEWKLLPQIFNQICQIKETPEIDLFASRLSH